MKFKYYLRGLGIGVIVTTLLFAIGGGVKTEPMKDSEIIQRARALGMVMQEESLPQSGTSKDMQSSGQQESAGSSEVSDQASGSDSDSDSESEPAQDSGDSGQTESQPDQAETPSRDVGVSAGIPETAPQPEETPQPVEQPDPGVVTFTVGAGMVSDTIARSLADMGVISDAQEFNLYLVQNGYDSRIFAGEKQVTVGANYDEIARALMSR